jgi:hypothetical protein
MSLTTPTVTITTIPSIRVQLKFAATVLMMTAMVRLMKVAVATPGMPMLMLTLMVI